MPGIGKGQIEDRRSDGRERRVDVAEPALADLADEAEREMKVLRLHPFRPRHAAAHGKKAFLKLTRKLDGDEKADHGGIPRS